MSDAPRDGSMFYGRVILNDEEVWIPCCRWQKSTRSWWEHFSHPISHKLLGWIPMGNTHNQQWSALMFAKNDGRRA